MEIEKNENISQIKEIEKTNSKTIKKLEEKILIIKNENQNLLKENEIKKIEYQSFHNQTLREIEKIKEDSTKILIDSIETLEEKHQLELWGCQNMVNNLKKAQNKKTENLLIEFDKLINNQKNDLNYFSNEYKQLNFEEKNLEILNLKSELNLTKNSYLQ